jgi:acyl-CoA synthetase (AMP-forming)/AMP-acid ligase II
LVSGRIDNCVNRLGFLVSTEEIETELEKLLPQLGQVIVVKDGNKETLTGTSVLAFVENTKDTPVDENTVKKKCITALPRHLVPDEIFFVHHFPRLSSGKVDRAALAQNLRP